MTDSPRTPESPEIPDAVSEPRRRFSVQLVWIIPIVALLVGLSIGLKSFMGRGQTITITFKTGEGLEAGKTAIKYKDVQIGEVKELAISSDRSHVVVTAEVSRDAWGLLVKDTRFWVVRARISGGNVTGLGTLLGGSYIGVDAGSSKEEEEEEFTGLEAPPAGPRVCAARGRHRLTGRRLAGLLPAHAGGAGDLDRARPGRHRSHGQGLRAGPL